MIGFPTRTPAELEDLPRHQQWLVEELWGHQAVGIIGGQPKCGKTFLGLHLAVAVASGVPCLRRFPVAQRGTVLMYVAEDGDHLVRWRLEDVATAAGVDFETLDIAVIDAPVLRLDDPGDRQRLHDTVGRVGPRLLILDPMVRLHAGDENAVATIAPILGFLRDLQRQFETGVVLVHHARKSAATRPGQALRGSGDFHAWGDSNLYLRHKRNGHILMSVEHRAAADREDIELEFTDAGEGAALRLCRGTAARQCANDWNRERADRPSARGRWAATLAAPDSRARREPARDRRYHPREARRRGQSQSRRGRLPHRFHRNEARCCGDR